MPFSSKIHIKGAALAFWQCLFHYLTWLKLNLCHMKGFISPEISCRPNWIETSCSNKVWFSRVNVNVCLYLYIVPLDSWVTHWYRLEICKGYSIWDHEVQNGKGHKGVNKTSTFRPHGMWQWYRWCRWLLKADRTAFQLMRWLAEGTTPIYDHGFVIA